MKMKSFLNFIAAITVMIFAAGCPVGTDYPLGEPGKNPIDKELIGTWKCKGETEEDCEVGKVTIKKGGDNSYEVKVLERGSMYALESDNLKGWVTELEGKKFVFFQPDNEEKFYLYCYQVKGKELHTWDVALKVGGIDAITSTEAFRQEVKASLKMEDCLSAEKIWSKE